MEKAIDGQKSQITVLAISTSGDMYFIGGTRKYKGSLPTFAATGLPIRKGPRVDGPTEVDYADSLARPSIFTSRMVLCGPGTRPSGYIREPDEAIVDLEVSVNVSRLMQPSDSSEQLDGEEYNQYFGETVTCDSAKIRPSCLVHAIE